MKQMIYTSCRSGEGNSLEGKSGFGVRAASKGMTPEEMDVLKSFVLYDPPAGNLPRSELPVRLALFDLPNDQRILCHSVDPGPDPETGRTGIFITHVVQGSREELPPDLAIASWNSPEWVAKDGDFSPQLDEISVPGGTSPSVVQFRSPSDRQLFQWTVSALLQGSARQKIFLKTEADTAAWLIGAIIRYLPRRVTREITFSTYEFTVMRSSAKITATWSPPDKNIELPNACFEGASFGFDTQSQRYTPVKTAILAVAAAEAIESGRTSRIDTLLDKLCAVPALEKHNVDLLCRAIEGDTTLTDSDLLDVFSVDELRGALLAMPQFKERARLLFLSPEVSPEKLVAILREVGEEHQTDIVLGSLRAAIANDRPKRITELFKISKILLPESTQLRIVAGLDDLSPHVKASSRRAVLASLTDDAVQDFRRTWLCAPRDQILALLETRPQEEFDPSFKTEEVRDLILSEIAAARSISTSILDAATMKYPAVLPPLLDGIANMNNATDLITRVVRHCFDQKKMLPSQLARLGATLSARGIHARTLLALDALFAWELIPQLRVRENADDVNVITDCLEAFACRASHDDWRAQTNVLPSLVQSVEQRKVALPPSFKRRWLNIRPFEQFHINQEGGEEVAWNISFFGDSYVDLSHLLSSRISRNVVENEHEPLALVKFLIPVISKLFNVSTVPAQRGLLRSLGERIGLLAPYIPELSFTDELLRLCGSRRELWKNTSAQRELILAAAFQMNAYGATHSRQLKRFLVKCARKSKNWSSAKAEIILCSQYDKSNSVRTLLERHGLVFHTASNPSSDVGLSRRKPTLKS